MRDEPACKVFLTVEDAEDFEELLERDGEHRGLFVPYEEDCKVGRKAWLWIAVRQTRSTISLEGTVLWRRLRHGGKTLPRGLFVALYPEDLANINRLLRYFDKDPANSPTRSHYRYPVVSNAVYTAQDQVYSASTRNISKGGASLVSKGPIPPLNQPTEVELRLGPEEHDVVRVSSRIAWLGTHRGMTALGVAFDEDQEGLDRIEALIGRMETQMRTLWAHR